MMSGATQKSPLWRRVLQSHRLAAASVWVAAITLASDGNPAPPAEAAHDSYQTARVAFETASKDQDVAWQFGRACFDWAEFSTNDTQRAELAKEGIRACEQALAKDPDLAAAHYYLAMNQGQRARTMSLGALKLVHQMEGHFLKARELDPEFDRGGPDRNLGLLYREAPGWPVSLGNRSKAKTHLDNAIEVAPDFPENRLNLMEAYARWDELALLKQELEVWSLGVDAAREAFSGARWHWDWLAWEERVRELRYQVARSSSAVSSPRNRS
jgi:tetratricopeptide (TPR) repeat protein